MHRALLAACTAFSPDDRAPHASVIVPAASSGAPTLRVSASVGSASSFQLSVEFLEAAEAEATWLLNPLSMMDLAYTKTMIMNKMKEGIDFQKCGQFGGERPKPSL